MQLTPMQPRATDDEIDATLAEVVGGDMETNLSNREIVVYMNTKDKMPDGVSLWEPLEYESPRRLVEHLF